MQTSDFLKKHGLEECAGGSNISLQMCELKDDRAPKSMLGDCHLNKCIHMNMHYDSYSGQRLSLSLFLHQTMVEMYLSLNSLLPSPVTSLQHVTSIFQLSSAVTFIDIMDLKCIFPPQFLHELINIQQVNDGICII